MQLAGLFRRLESGGFDLSGVPIGGSQTCRLGGPKYALMSTRSRNAASIASVMLLVVNSITFGSPFRLSSAVSNALTARTASAGSDPLTAACRAAVSDSTCRPRKVIARVTHFAHLNILLLRLYS